MSPSSRRYLQLKHRLLDSGGPPRRHRADSLREPPSTRSFDVAGISSMILKPVFQRTTKARRRRPRITWTRISRVVRRSGIRLQYMLLLCHEMKARAGDRTGTDHRRRTVLCDGGEMLCVACGEAYEVTSKACPVCGHRPSTNGTTGDQGTGSTENEDPSTAADPAPEVLDEGDSPGGGHSGGTKTAKTHAAGGRREDSTSGTKISPADDRRSDQDPTGKPDTTKSPLVAAALSFILIGAGHVYIGEIKRGVGVFLGAIGVLFVTVLTLGLGTPLMLVVWVWGMYDAYKRAA